MPEFLAALTWWQMVLSLIVTLLGAARLTRLVVHDTFPPSIYLRIWWDKHTEKSSWNTLLHCHWCFGYWATVFVVGTYFLTFLAPWVAWSWWIIFGTLALSYLVSQYVHFDQGMDEV